MRLLFGIFWPWYIQISVMCKQGHLDVELNENGREQAAVVSSAFFIFPFSGNTFLFMLY